MNTKLEYIYRAITICLLGVLLLNQISSYFKSKEYSSLIESLANQNTLLYENLETVKIKETSLEEAIVKLSDENTKVLALLSNQKPNEVKYITRTETTLAPTVPVEKATGVPEHYSYVLNSNIPIAEFDYTNGESIFTTHSLKYKQTVILTKDEANALLQVSSSADNIWHDLPTDVVVLHTESNEKYPRFSPNLNLGLGSMISPDLETFIPYPAIGINTLYLHKNIAVLSPSIGLAKHPNAGINVVSYNIGGPLPGVSDIWISAGPQINTELQVGAGINLFTNL